MNLNAGRNPPLKGKKKKKMELLASSSKITSEEMTDESDCLLRFSLSFSLFSFCLFIFGFIALVWL